MTDTPVIAQENLKGFADAFGGRSAQAFQVSQGTQTEAAATETAAETTVTETAATETTAVETTTAAETTTETTTTEPVYTGSQLMEWFGSQDVEQIKTTYTQNKEKAAIAAQLEAEANELKGFRAFVEKPFSNDKLAEIDKFGRQTGVTDVEVATKFVGKQPDLIGQKPLEALALAEIISNPTSYKGISFNQVVSALSEEFGIEEGTTVAELSQANQLKLSRAVNTIADAMQKPDTHVDPWSTYQSKVAEQKQAIEAIKQSWQGKEIKPEATYTYKHAGNGDLPAFEITEAVPAEIQKQVQSEIQAILNSNPTPHNEQVEQSLKEWTRGRVSQLMSSIVTEKAINKAVDSLKGALKEQIAKEYHNGSPIERTERVTEKEVDGNSPQAVFSGMLKGR